MLAACRPEVGSVQRELWKVHGPRGRAEFSAPAQMVSTFDSHCRGPIRIVRVQ